MKPYRKNQFIREIGKFQELHIFHKDFQRCRQWRNQSGGSKMLTEEYKKIMEDK